MPDRSGRLDGGRRISQGTNIPAKRPARGRRRGLGVVCLIGSAHAQRSPRPVVIVRCRLFSVLIVTLSLHPTPFRQTYQRAGHSASLPAVETDSGIYSRWILHRDHRCLGWASGLPVHPTVDGVAAALVSVWPRGDRDGRCPGLWCSSAATGEAPRLGRGFNLAR